MIINERQYPILVSKQSPKIKSNLYRPKTPSLFSILDVKDRYNSKGPSVKFQYERDNFEKELNININLEKVNPQEKAIEQKIERSKNRSTSSIIQKETNIFQSPNNNNFKRESNCKSTLDNNNILESEQKLLYKRVIKSAIPSLSRECALKYKEQLNKTIRENKPVNTREIKNKFNESDIFMIKETKTVKGAMNHIKERHHFQNKSDIFNFNEELSCIKTGEKYTVKPFKPKEYSVSTKSKSEWEPAKPQPCLINHSNSEYLLYNDGVKNITKTKKEIIKEANNLNFKAENKQKMISAFHSLVNREGGHSNQSKVFQEAYQKDVNCFKRKANHCWAFYDIHRQYGVMLKPPFKK